VRRDYRKKGITSVLITEALRIAKRANAPALEAYPRDAGKSPGSTFIGYVSTFSRAGFEIVGRHNPVRPVMRHNL
jgi:GNAT superfamily N-acetyltransferase